MKYIKHNHSVSFCQYHFVFVTKYRHKILKGEFNSFIKSIVKGNFDVIAVGTHLDHIHILSKALPKYSPSDLVRQIKSLTTVKAYKHYLAYLKQYYWNRNMLWSRGYFVCTTGQVNSDTIKEYINNQ